MSNAPDRFALFILQEGEERVTSVTDSRIPNAVTFTLHKEDHTLGNMIRHAILAQPGVLFCGYRVPHPLEPRTEIRVQTDGEQTPQQVMKAACEQLIKQCTDVKSQFEEQAKQMKGGAFGHEAGADANAYSGFDGGYGGTVGGSQYVTDI